MKKILELLKPFISIVFGVLIIFLFLNGLTDGGTTTAKSVFAFLVGSYFIVVGLLGVLAAQQIGENNLKLLNAIGISVFATFIFVVKMLVVIDLNDAIKVAGWIISIFTLLVASGFAALFIVNLFVKNEQVAKITGLLGLLFLLTLLVDIIFDDVGDPLILGLIEVLKVAVYASFAYIYLGNLKE